VVRNFQCGWLVLLALAGDVLAGEEAVEQNPRGYQEWLSSLEESPLDLNRADAHQLALLPGLSEELAGRIVRLRERLGPFREVEDLLRVEGMDAEVLAGIRPYVTCGRPFPLRWRVRMNLTEGLGGRARAYLSSERTRMAVLAEGSKGRKVRLGGYFSWTRGRWEGLLGDFRPGFGQGLIFSYISRSFEGAGRAYRPPRTTVGYAAGKGPSLRGGLLEGRAGPVRWASFWGEALDEAL